MLCQLPFRRFMFSQHLARPRDHVIRQACEFGDFDAVAAVRSAGLDLAQEDDSASGFFHRDMVVFHSGELLGQFC